MEEVSWKVNRLDDVELYKEVVPHNKTSVEVEGGHGPWPGPCVHKLLINKWPYFLLIHLCANFPIRLTDEVT